MAASGGGAAAAAAEDINAELLRAHSVIMHDTLAYALSMCLKSAVELNIPSIISSHGGTMTLSDLISELDIPRSSSSFVRRILRVLVHKGYFIHDKKLDTYSLTPFSRVLVEDSPTSLLTYVLGVLDVSMTSPWNSLSTFCRMEQPKGSTVYELEYGKSVWQLVEESPEFAEVMSRTMDGDSRALMKPLLAKCAESFQGLTTLVDVGGGDGTMANAIAKAFPHTKCTVFDLPHVVANVPQGSLVQAVGGSMLDHIPQANAVLMKNVLHDWPDEDCVKILKLCRKAIPSKEEGGKVMVMDIVIDASCTDDFNTEGHLFFDMAMMVWAGGREREEHEWKKLFMDAGFTDYKITRVGLRSLMEVFP